MKVEQAMVREVISCMPDDDMGVAARIMWEHDCGCVPVVDGSGRVIAMITDRDICMAAWSRGLPVEAMKVAQAMSRVVVTCSPDESVLDAEVKMGVFQVRRLPVVDHEHRLIGVLSVADLLRHTSNGASRHDESLRGALQGTLLAISGPGPSA